MDSKLKRGFLGLLAGLAIAAIWEWLAKPGLLWVGRTAVALLSSVSSTFRDDPYVAASRGNPTEVAMMVVFASLGMMAVFLLAVWFMAQRLTRRVPTELRTQSVAAPVTGAGIGMFLGMIAVVLTTFGPATGAWRTFHRTMDAYGPILTVPEVQGFRRRFATMKTRAEYDAVMRELDTLATQRGLPALDRAR
jgi:hypothetical protein